MMENNEIFTSDYPCRILNSDDAHYFYGYYDLMPFSADGARHLCHRVPFFDRQPGADDVAGLGYLEDGRFNKLAETTAWNFQQGSMLQYGWENPDLLFYNIRADGGFHTVRQNLKTGARVVTDRATATVARSGRFGLAVNFSRIFDFRPGYGYAGIPDPYADVGSPKDDGVFYVDFETGKSRMLVSYDRLWREFPIPGMENAKFLVNHITLNPSGDRYLMLVRNFRAPGVAWKTTLFTGDMEGNINLVSQNTMVSHYWWTDDRHVLAYCASPTEPNGLFLIEDLTNRYSPRVAPDINTDIHCITDPSGRWFIGDSYPYAGFPYRRIMLNRLPDFKETRVIAKVLTDLPSNGEIRCDLHDRWSRDGRHVTFDSTHRGRRDIVQMDMSPLFDE